MKTLAIVYFSGTGHTKLMAEAVAKGAAAVEGINVEVLAILGKDIVEGRYTNKELLEKLTASDGIIFGTPTYMGNVAGQFKTFADATAGIWFGQGWKNKVAGGFTGSGNPSGDKLQTLTYLAVLAAQHGMVWINNGEFPSHYLGKTDGVNRLGASLGIMAQNTSPQGSPAELYPGDELTAIAYGRRVAEFTLKLTA